MRISNSFSEGEIQVLEFILQTLLRGGTPHLATRNKDFASLYRKTMVMKKKVHEKKDEAKAKEAATASPVDMVEEGADVIGEPQQAAG